MAPDCVDRRPGSFCIRPCSHPWGKATEGGIDRKRLGEKPAFWPAARPPVFGTCLCLWSSERSAMVNAHDDCNRRVRHVERKKRKNKISTIAGNRQARCGECVGRGAAGRSSVVVWAGRGCHLEG